MTARAGSRVSCAPASVPLPPGARTILVYGGAFDPPHNAHFTLPILARDALAADYLLYVPADRSPHKQTGPIAVGADRVAMLRAGLGDADRAGVSTIELERGSVDDGPSYTIDTLRELASRLGAGVRLRLLIGADQAREFHRWREPREIIELAEPAVMLRGGDRGELLEAMRPHWSAGEMGRWESRLLDLPLMDVSATEVRRIIRARGAAASELRELMPGAVIDVIRERGLYRSV